MVLTRFSAYPQYAVGKLVVGHESKYLYRRKWPHISKCVAYQPDKIYPFLLADGSSWVFVNVWR